MTKLIAALSLTLLIGAAARDAGACSMASQLRELPLGFSQGRLVTLTLELYRDDAHRPRFHISWSGTASLTHWTDPRQVRALGKVAFAARRYTEALRPTLAGALAEARKLPGFVPLAAPTTRYCDLERATCAGVRRAGRTLAIDALGGRARGSLGVPAVAERQLRRGRLQPKESVDTILPHLRVSSIRRYPRAAGDVFVINVGVGDPKFTMPHLAGRTDRCPDLASCVPREQTLHHAVAFDVVVIGGTPRP